MNVGNAPRPAPLKFDSRRQRMRLHPQVRSPHRRAQIRAGGTPAPSAMDGHVHPPEALLSEAIDVFGDGVAGLPPGFDPGTVERIGQCAVARMERPGITPVSVAALGTVLRPAEIG